MSEQGPKSVLVVDDDPPNYILCARIIEAEFPETNILIACNGNEGIRLARQYQPDIILCDLLMPDLNGFEVCRVLSSDEKTMSIPFVIVTAYGDSDKRAKAFEIGASDYIAKPFDFDEFIEMIKKVLRGKRLGLYNE